MVYVPSCGFTNCESSTQLRQRNLVCKGSNNNRGVRKQVVFIGCNSCTKNSTVWRCTQCYSEMSNAIKLNNRVHDMVDIPILQFLLFFEWRSVTSTNVLDFANDSKDYLFTQSCKWIPKEDSFVFIWKNHCPCCYCYLFPTIPMPFGKFGYESYQSPRLSKVSRLRFQCSQIDAVNKKWSVTSITIVIIVLQPVMTPDVEKHFQYRNSNELNDSGINEFISVEKLIYNYDLIVEDSEWILLLGNTESEMQVLSLKKKGALNKHINLDSSNEIRAVSSIFAKIASNCLPDKRADTTNVQQNNCSRKSKKNRIIKDLYNIALNTNRSSGPNGNASGMQIDDIRCDIFSGKVNNCVPRSSIATVLVPYYANKNSHLVTRVQPFYCGVKSNNINDNIINYVVSPPNCAIPKLGFIVSYQRFWHSLLDELFLKYYQIERRKATIVQNIVVEECTNLVNGCYILEKLVHLFPDIYKLNEATYKNGIDKWKKIVENDSNGNISLMIESLCQLGRLSFVIQGVSGHCDNYDGKVTTDSNCETLESKFTILLGNKKIDESGVSGNENVGIIPTGGLGYPRYMVYSMCNPMSDLEYHQLTKVIHLSGINTLKTHRGCSVVMNGEKHIYPYGAAMTRMI
jgi:hypothetical protein